MVLALTVLTAIAASKYRKERVILFQLLISCGCRRVKICRGSEMWWGIQKILRWRARRMRLVDESQCSWCVVPHIYSACRHMCNHVCRLRKTRRQRGQRHRWQVAMIVMKLR